jgi:hypothetical protein
MGLGLMRLRAKNKKKLKDGYDPSRREPKERLQAEFNTSIGKLAPLLTYANSELKTNSRQSEFVSVRTF